MGQAMTIFLVDDDKAVRESTTIALRQSGYAVKEFACGQAFLDYYQYAEPGCLVIDLQLPDISGLEVQASLRSSGFSLPTIFISGHGDIPTTVNAIRGGAADFIEKPFARSKLVERIELVLAQHDSFATQAMPITDAAQAAQIRSIRQRVTNLTGREQEVMQLITEEGLSSKEIARRLAISPRTVESHRANLMKKMRARNLAELCHLVGMAGLFNHPTAE